tara:strand:+ start:450 stop:617 length:168 start_codon:yes stop_codon:yes gene_type:complete
MEIDIESMKSTIELYWDISKRKPLKGNPNKILENEFTLYIEQIDLKDESDFIILT